MAVNLKKLEVYPAPLYFGLKGEKGNDGDIGPQGPKGDPGTDLTYLHDQSVPALEWNIAHNLDKYCSTTVIDSAGSVVFGDVQYIDTNNLKIVFTAAFSGKAFCN